MNLDSLKSAFSGFDVNDLDFATAGSWPIGVKVVTYLIAFGAIVAAGLHFYVDDKNSDLERQIKREDQFKAEYNQKALDVANLDALRRQMADVEDRFAEMLRQLPSRNEVPGLLDDITNIGRNSGLDIKLIALQDEKKAPFYIELPIDITVSGTYHQMGEFVSGVAAIPRIVTLHNYTISPDRKQQGQLTMNILAKTYRYDEEPQAENN